MDIKAVAFDLDGTLYPELMIFFPSLGLFIRHPRFIFFFNKVRKEIRSIHPIHDFKRLQAELVARYMQMTVSACERFIEKIIYDQWMHVIRIMKPYAGIRDLIIALKHAGYKTALLSDMPVDKKLCYLGLEGIWDFAFSSEETGYLKPNREPFQKLIECVREKPEHILYIGNNYGYDIVGAQRMGIKTAHFSRRRVNGSIADYSLRHYRDLVALISSLLKKKRLSTT